MKKFAFSVGIVALALLFMGFASGTSTPIEGDWIGEFTAIDHSVPIKVHFWRHDGALKGEITLRDGNSRELPLSWVMAESTSIHFELVEPSRTLVFDGVLRNGLITGDLLYANLRGTFQLTPQKVVNL